MLWDQLPSLFPVSFSPSGTQEKEVEGEVGWEVLPTWPANVPASLSFLDSRLALPLPARLPSGMLAIIRTGGEASTLV